MAAIGQDPVMQVHDAQILPITLGVEGRLASTSPSRRPAACKEPARLEVPLRCMPRMITMGLAVMASASPGFAGDDAEAADGWDCRAMRLFVAPDGD